MSDIKVAATREGGEPDAVREDIGEGGARKARPLVLATKNPHKVAELKTLLHRYGFELFSLNDFPGIELPEEDGQTFLENAAVKATYVGRHTGMLALADDSGLMVDALSGAPGVKSARFSGAKLNIDQANNKKLLAMLSGFPPERRGAAFRCVIALADDKDNFFYFEGECPGQIAERPAGEGGFGYDPLFYLPSYGRTMAELSAGEKNAVSHRGIAMEKCLRVLSRMADD